MRLANGLLLCLLTVRLCLSGAVAQTSQGSPGPAAETPAPGAGMSDVQWAGFTDPNEKAFSTEVPQGWHVMGGTYRRNFISATPWLRMLSPDRQTYIVVGDSGITYFTAPLSAGPTPRPRPGQVFKPYLPGAAFAQDYVARVVPEVCQNVAVAGQKERPDLLQVPGGQANPFVRRSAGEVTFTCTLRGAPARGMVVAVTFAYPPAPLLGGTIWSVGLLAGFIATPDRYAEAGRMTVHIVLAWRENPDWVRQEQAKIDALTRGINDWTRWSAGYSQQQIARSQQQLHMMGQQSEAFDRILTGSSPFADAAGNVYHLDNTRTQWLGPGNRTLGTSGASPGPGWQRLNEVPPQ